MVWFAIEVVAPFSLGSTNVSILLMAMNLGFIKPSLEKQNFILHFLAHNFLLGFMV
jgi:hypothetical protein